MPLPNEFVFDNPRCFANHLGPWAIEPQWMKNAVNLMKNGVLAESAPVEELETDFQLLSSGIAVLHISGQMQKGFSKFGGTSTIEARKLLRQAVRAESVKEILMVVDSPGGTVAGTAELADDISAADQIKPITVQVVDLAASAALWVSSQAREVFSNRMAQIGSIGVFSVVEDTSGEMERKGVKVHVISTGEHKGAMVPGSEVTDEHLAELQRSVDAFNEVFIEAVATGRDMSAEQVEQIADGRMFHAPEALELGLIDRIQSLDETIKMMEARISTRERATRESALIKRMERMK